jgi:DNA-binding CsgD family transcriptional regulator
MTRAYRAAYGIDLPTAMRRGRGWGNTARLPAFATSEEYGNVWLPARFRHGIEVTAVQNGRGWGSFVLWRGLGGRAFSAQEEALFAPLSPFLGHAVRGPARGPLPGADAPETGVVISDKAGRIIYRSACTERLLQLASAQPTIFTEPSRTLPDWLRLLIGRLLRVHDDPTVRPPIAFRRNRWGDFTCRAYPLLEGDVDPRSAARFAIYIEYRKPLAVQITRAAFVLGFSARQSELCVYLATGASYVDVARRMGVRPSTVVDHVRKLYVRLNVRDRESLLGTLRSVSAIERS